MSCISTKTGDQGTTALIDGQRVAKDELIIQVLGELDELNSWLGLVAAQLYVELAKNQLEHSFLLTIQQKIMQMSAELAGVKSDQKKIKISTSFVKQLEREITRLQTKIGDNWQQQFLLPGGVKIAAYADLARAVCRRTERSLVALNHALTVRPELLQLLNRLSDYLYVLRCYLNWINGFTENAF